MRVNYLMNLEKPAKCKIDLKRKYEIIMSYIHNLQLVTF